MSAHPKPVDMAREAMGSSCMGGVPVEVFAAGASAERARVVADLLERARRIRERKPNEYAMIVVAYLETYADDLEGKPLPTATAAHACGLRDAREVTT